MVPVEWGGKVSNFLKQEGFHPIYQEYPMGHEISPALFAGLIKWIFETLPTRQTERGGHI
jgi:predicted esterase